jgi:hypothetical protein
MECHYCIKFAAVLTAAKAQVGAIARITGMGFMAAVAARVTIFQVLATQHLQMSPPSWKSCVTMQPLFLIWCNCGLEFPRRVYNTKQNHFTHAKAGAM